MFKYVDNEGLKKEIKKNIIDNNYTQKEIAEKMGMIPQTYNTLINKKNFSFNDLKRICDAMNCDLYIDIREKEEPIAGGNLRRKKEKCFFAYNRRKLVFLVFGIREKEIANRL